MIWLLGFLSLLLLAAGALVSVLAYPLLARSQTDFDRYDHSLRRRFSQPQLLETGALMFQGPRWRQRSVRKLRFLSPDSVAIRVSFDFVVPEDEILPPLRPNEQSIVPLLLVTKEKLSTLDLRDESGAALPILNRADENELTTILLAGLWSEYFPNQEWLLDEEVVDSLRRIVRLPPSLAADEYYRFVALVVQPSSLQHEEDSTVTDVQTRFLSEDAPDRLREFFLIVQRFITDAQLYAVLPRLQPGSRRILKLVFRDSAPWRRVTPWGAVWLFVRGLAETLVLPRIARHLARRDAVLRARLEVQANGHDIAVDVGAATRETRPGTLEDLAQNLRSSLPGMLSRLGIMSRPYAGEFSTFFARAEHLEIEAPPGTYFSGGWLSMLEDTEQGEMRRPLDKVRRGATHAHLYTAFADGSGPRQFELRLRAQRRGWLLSATIATVTVATILTVAYVERATITDAGTAALISIVLGVGAAAVVYLARPNEHAMTTRLLEGPRLALAAAAIAALGAILLMALDVAGSTRTALTFSRSGGWPLAVASVSAALFVLNYVGAWIGRAVEVGRSAIAALTSLRAESDAESL